MHDKSELRSNAINWRYVLILQRVCGWLLLPVFWLLIVGLMRYRGFSIENLAQVRDRFKRIVSNDSPLLVCCNHLTLIDSVILHWAFGSLWWYLLNYRFFLWNIPARENATSKLSWRFLTFFGKCLFIDRAGGAEHTGGILEQVNHCLATGDCFLVFPEGTRSRSGRVEPKNVTYGVGKIIQASPGLKVLCVYLRGGGQVAYSDFPQRNEQFKIDMQLIQPHSIHQGLRATRDYSQQIINKIKELEDNYFAQRVYSEDIEGASQKTQALL